MSVILETLPLLIVTQINDYTIKIYKKNILYLKIYFQLF